MTTTRHVHIAAMLVAILTAAAALAAPATAARRPVAAPGVAIYIRDANNEMHQCTLGYAARDARGDRLAVTAGHCVEHLHQQVYLANRVSIGTVMAWKPDNMHTGDYGYTVIALYDDVAQTPAINPGAALDHTGIAHTGDHVCMFGVASGRTCGAIRDAAATLITTNGNIADHGDSGAPVVRVEDGALLGIVIGGSSTAEHPYTTIQPAPRIAALVRNFPELAGFGPVVANPRR